MESTNHFEVKQVRSAAGRPTTQRQTLRGLGLTRLGKTVFLKDTPAVRGMLYKVVHLVEVKQRQGEPPLSSRGMARSRKNGG